MIKIVLLILIPLIFFLTIAIIYKRSLVNENKLNSDLIFNKMVNKIVFDEKIDNEPGKQDFLKSDIITMWKLVALNSSGPNGNEVLMVSPVSAINAANRYFESEHSKLIGMTKEELLKSLAIPISHKEYSYNFPFHPLALDEFAMVFRFDCGKFGWQFDFLYDDSGVVKKYRRQWIH